MAFLDKLPETLHSERLLIRVARPGDGALFNEALLDSHVELAPWLGWMTPVPTLADIGQPGAVVAMAALIATQALLVILCFAVGRGIGGVLGFKPALPFWLPLALSFLAVPVSRLIWNPQVMAENIGFDPLLHLPDAQQGGHVAEGAALPDSVTGPEMKQPVSAVSTLGDTGAQTPVSSRNDP